MAALRTLLFNILFVLETAYYVLSVIIVSPFGNGPVRRQVHAWSAGHYWLVQHVLGIRFEWDGEIPAGPYLIAVKHQAMVEAVDTLRFARLPVVVMKRELSHMPLWGNAARAYGVIGVDRDAGAKALREMMVEARAAAATRRPVLIFPEGTRVPFGEKPPLQAGFAGLYRVLGLPVVPIALDSARLWPRGSFVKQSGTITFKVGEIIPPGLKRDDIEALVHTAINALNP